MRRTSKSVPNLKAVYLMGKAIEGLLSEFEEAIDGEAAGQTFIDAMRFAIIKAEGEAYAKGMRPRTAKTA